MTLPVAYNTISLNNVNTELSFSATALISMNDAAVRTLFGRAGSGTTISMSDGHGKSSSTVLNITIAVNTRNYNVRTAAVAAGWGGVTPVIATININAGIIVGSEFTTFPSISSGSNLPAGSSLTINIAAGAYLVGAGGHGNKGGGLSGTTRLNGFTGGTALYTSVATIVNNLGTFAGGGGGGGGGPGRTRQVGKSINHDMPGAGGGGAGDIIGPIAPINVASKGISSNAGGTVTLTTGGTGGTANFGGAINNGTAGGNLGAGGVLYGTEGPIYGAVTTPYGRTYVLPNSPLYLSGLSTGVVQYRQTAYNTYIGSGYLMPFYYNNVIGISYENNGLLFLGTAGLVGSPSSNVYCLNTSGDVLKILTNNTVFAYYSRVGTNIAPYISEESIGAPNTTTIEKRTNFSSNTVQTFTVATVQSAQTFGVFDGTNYYVVVRTSASSQTLYKGTNFTTMSAASIVAGTGQNATGLTAMTYVTGLYIIGSVILLHGYLGTTYYVSKSTNGGSSWSTLFTGTNVFSILKTNVDNRLYIFSPYTPGVQKYTTDGNNWIDLTGLSYTQYSTQYRSFYFLQNGNIIMTDASNTSARFYDITNNTTSTFTYPALPSQTNAGAYCVKTDTATLTVNNNAPLGYLKTWYLS